MKSKKVLIDDIEVSDQFKGENYEMSDIEKMSDSIKKDGLLNPVIVRKLKNGKYKLVAGGLRLNACKKLGRSEICVSIQPKKNPVLSLIENFMVKQKNCIQYADDIKKLVDDGHSSVLDLSKKLCKTEKWMNNTLKIASLSKTVRTTIKALNFSLKRSQLLALAKLESKSKQLEAVRDLKLKYIKGGKAQNASGISELHNKYMTVNELANVQNIFSASSLRDYIFNQKTNGMADAQVVIKNGSRVFINVENFWKWVECRNSNKKAS
jgi:ParB/RepB/Spo0J family partition protein